MREILKTISDSVEATEKIGRSLGELVLADNNIPRFIALCGDLGAGKTAFTRGFCSVFCTNATVRSPSFALVNEYRGSPDVYHFDVWRVTDDDDLYSTGFYDYQERDGIIICEWADNIEYALPERFVRVDILGNGNVDRKITVGLIGVDR